RPRAAEPKAHTSAGAPSCWDVGAPSLSLIVRRHYNDGVVMVFRSKIDVRLVTLLGCVAALLLWSAWHMYVTAAPPRSLFAFINLAMAASIIWQLIRTQYVVTSGEVIVRSGLFTTHIPLK